MSRAKFRVHYEKSFQCRCGKWKARARCVLHELRDPCRGAGRGRGQGASAGAAGPRCEL